VGRLKDLHIVSPSRFRYTTFWAPSDFWGPGTLAETVALVAKVAESIKEGESWKIMLRRTCSHIPEVSGLIETLPDCVLRSGGDMLNPEKILLVHIVGEETAVSLLSPDQILDLESDMIPPAAWGKDETVPAG
jgi:hypothetical protein